MEFQRKAEKSYTDPVSLVWIRAAERFGLRVMRTDDAYASYDGNGTLLISKDAHLDADDSLAQMILHELCHAAVGGEGAKEKLDWGLSNEDGRDLVSEQACHRLQAALARRHGLREFFAVTTDHRPYWDALPIDPLAPADDPAVALARDALQFARATELARIIDDALAATRAIAEVAKRHAPSSSLWAALTALHASGFPLHEDAAVVCGMCAWHFTTGKQKTVHRCRQTRVVGNAARSVSLDSRGCVRFEPAFDEQECGPCGACCREGFHMVMVGKREPITRRHLALLVEDGHGYHVPRPGGVCVALSGDGASGSPYRCDVYAARPRSCRDFAVRSDACLTARRRVAVSH
jgi:hypothetical protein